MTRPPFQPCRICREEGRDRPGDGFFGFGWPGEASRRVSHDILHVCSEHTAEAAERQQKALKKKGLAA